MALASLSKDEQHIIVECSPIDRALLQEGVPGATQRNGKILIRKDPTVPTLLNRTLGRVKVTKELGLWILSTMTAEVFPGSREDIKHPRANDLRNYQVSAVHRLQTKDTTLLADEMGLGKTVMTLVAIEASEHKDRVLIVCPSCIKPQWRDEIRKWGADSKGSVTLKRKISPVKRDRLWDQYVSEEERYFLIHWEALRLMPQISAFQWDWVVMDEAHYMKNRKAKRTKEAFGLKARKKVLLTGTPIINRPDELWSLLHFMNPKEFRSYWRFFESFVDYVDQEWGRLILGVKNVVTLQALLRPYVMRRLKKDCLPDLPPKIYTTIAAEMRGGQKTLYKKVLKEVLIDIEGRDEPLTIVNAAARTVRLRQAATSTAFFGTKDQSNKLSSAAEITRNAVESGEAVIIFTTFRRTADLMAKRVPKAGVYHGGTSDEDLRRFMQGDIDTLVMTIDAGGIGLSLERASTAIFVELPWSPAKLMQAEDRLHRFGQTKPVNIIYVVSEGSIDEKIADVLERKGKLIDDILFVTEVIGNLRE